MSKIADIYIDSWGDEFIVSGYFGDMTVVKTRAFKTYEEALVEMQRQVLREKLRYETNFNGYNRR